MYRVLLADDEIHVCQLIEHLVEWETLDAELCGAAHDGVEALELIERLRPHVVISDIRMSGLDGISLLEKVRNAGISCAFILVSGYRQFDYAQKAIQLGVTDYLVKPIKKRELNRAIEKGIRELASEVCLAGRTPLGEGDPADLARAIETGDSQLDQPLSALTARYEPSLGENPQIYYGKFVCGESFSSQTLDLLYHHLSARLWETADFSAALTARYEDGFLLLAGFRTQPPGLQSLQRRFQSILSNFAHWIVLLSAGTPQAGESLRDAAERVRFAAETHYFHPGKTAFPASAAPPSFLRFQELLENLGSLPDAMQVLDGPAVRRQMESDLHILEAAGDPEAVFRYAAWCVDAMNHALSAFTAAQGGLEELQYLHRNEILRELRHCPSIVSLSARLCEVTSEKIQSARQMIEQLENRPVRIVRDMVARRYREHISLNDAAEATGLNPVYLSVLFKKETGVNFKDYVANVRMEKAKEFLRQGESISRVTELVGYQDAKYFSRLFTRVVGVNPTQYKKLYL